MLEVILDTETTGLSTTQKHRIVEIACVELNNQITTGKVFHTYIIHKDLFRKMHLRFMDIPMNFYPIRKNLMKL